MAHSYEEPAGHDMTPVEDGFDCEQVWVLGDLHVTFRGVSGSVFTVRDDDLPRLAALALEMWSENAVIDAPFLDDDDDDEI